MLFYFISTFILYIILSFNFILVIGLLQLNFFYFISSTVLFYISTFLEICRTFVLFVFFILFNL